MTKCQQAAQHLLAKMNRERLESWEDFVFEVGDSKFLGIGSVYDGMLTVDEPISNGWNGWECEMRHVEEVINLVDGTMPSFWYRVHVIY